ncbi:MAG: peptidase M4 [endosymbiont of Galathealinum brachiosum]|uniref:Peptidase M4 n=1 Tax=endosymbiont of Galathealinum brachiosum TaxID=2200906 RepID=A0A370DEH7_9GAMM|nr:MAG: peptidase M4 [endosymbiont of Galathealinum brachiosum]
MASGMTRAGLRYTLNMKNKILIIISLLLILSPLTTIKVAHADDDYIEARRLQNAGEILSLENILKIIRPEFPGRILEVELESEDGQIVYEVEILSNNGIVREIYINARTGKLLSVKEED